MNEVEQWIHRVRPQMIMPDEVLPVVREIVAELGEEEGAIDVGPFSYVGWDAHITGDKVTFYPVLYGVDEPYSLDNYVQAETIRRLQLEPQVVMPPEKIILMPVPWWVQALGGELEAQHLFASHAEAAIAAFAMRMNAVISG